MFNCSQVLGLYHLFPQEPMELCRSSSAMPVRLAKFHSRTSLSLKPSAGSRGGTPSASLTLYSFARPVSTEPLIVSLNHEDFFFFLLFLLPDSSGPWLQHSSFHSSHLITVTSLLYIRTSPGLSALFFTCTEQTLQPHPLDSQFDFIDRLKLSHSPLCHLATYPHPHQPPVLQPTLSIPNPVTDDEFTEWRLLQVPLQVLYVARLQKLGMGHQHAMLNLPCKWPYL